MKAHGTKSPARTQSPGKCGKNGDKDPDLKEPSNRLPKVYKWSFQMSDLENMTSAERITILQEKLQEIRKHYLSLKSEVASIDRRRKRLKKKERESAATSSSSSSPSSSSITAAVMLTLAEPSMASSSQNGMSVECRWQQDLLEHFALNGWRGPRLFYTAQWHKKNETSTILYLKIVSWQADLALKCTFLWRKSTMNCFSSSNNCFQLVWELCVW